MHEVEPSNSTERDYLNIRKMFNQYYLRTGAADFLNAIETSLYIQENFLEKQIIPAGPFYRGISLKSIPKVGDVFESNYSGWLLNKKTAEQFSSKAKGDIKVVVCTNKNKVLLSFNSFGPLIQSKLNKSDYLHRKIRDKLSYYEDPGQDELIMKPFNSKILSVIIHNDRHGNITYYIEV